MTDLHWIRQALADRRPGIVAQKTGLHINTIIRIRDADDQNPKLKTLEKLASYLIGDGEK